MADGDIPRDPSPPAITKEDERRSRALRRYLQPQNIVDEAKQRLPSHRRAADGPSSPDAVLTALAQLICLRLNTKRAIISVIDLNTTYTLAEGTRSLNLIDTHQSEEGDGLYIGCASLDKATTLCQNVVAIPLDRDRFPIFLVPDLSEDERFSHMPMVSDPARFRFYAGTPLVTEQGVSIGAVAAIDTEKRAGLTLDQQEFLVHIGRTIMNQLELKRQADERIKIVRMSQGLNAFIQGRSEIVEEELSIPDVDQTHSSSEPGRSSLETIQPTPPDATEKPKVLVDVERSTSQTSESTDFSDNPSPGLHDKFSAGADRKSIDDEYRRTLSRAAGLLHESMGFKEDGGVVFFEATLGVSTNEGESQRSATAGEDEDIYSPTSFAFDSNPGASPVTAKILGISPRNSTHGTKTQATPSPIRPAPRVPQLALQSIFKKYKRGKLWTFDGDFGIVSSDEDQPILAERRASSTDTGPRRRRAAADLLQNCFPGARHILFVPLWDAALSRNFSACFCYTTSPLTILAEEPDLNFVTAFANSIMTEVSRIKTVIADQQKGDFIGSISHELRSPLHGVLASAEFLAETECSDFQKSLIDTVESCGRTLLDTINHVLDFSRINAFEKTLRNSKKARTSNFGKVNGMDKNQKPLPGLLSIFAQTDVSAITEEVVDSVFSGRMYSNISPADITDVAASSLKVRSARGNATSTTESLDGPGTELNVIPVDIVLDIKHGNYKFFTQPGALRRVIMNIFGNSLKYTDKGMILIQTRLEDYSEPSEDDGKHYKKNLRLTFRDTGKGISPNYLRTRLFTPFAQENVLAQGTGLGLSIVKSIVTMLGGSIKINSTLGVGTEVIINLPMAGAADGDELSASSPASVTIPQNDTITRIRALGMTKKIGVYGFDLSKVSELDMQKVLESYITKWYGLDYVSAWVSADEVDVVIVDQKNLAMLIDTHPFMAAHPLIVLCSNMSRRSLPSLSSSMIEHIVKPPGPYKLAKAIQTSIQKMIAKHNVSSISESVDGAADVDPIESKVRVYNESLSITQEAMRNVSLGGHSQPVDQTLETGTETSSMQRNPGLVAQISATDIPVICDQITSITTPSEAPGMSSTPLQRQPIGSPGVPPPKSSRAPRILLVDDNSINLRLLETFMKKRKYEDVDTAENGLLAFQAAEGKNYDVIFMDLSMPVMDGFEATRAIRKLERERCEKRQQDSRESYFGGVVNDHVDCSLIIALTGLASSRDQVEASSCGINIYMTKPVSFKDVGAILADWEKYIVGELRHRNHLDDSI